MLLVITKDGVFAKTFGLNEKPFQAEKLAKEWIANEYKRHPNSTYKLTAWYEDLDYIFKKLQTEIPPTRINWAWDNPTLNNILDEDEDIT